MLAETLELLPTTPELVWGLIAFLFVLGLIVLIVVLVIRASRRRSPSPHVTSRLEELEARVSEFEGRERLEE